VSPAYRGVLFDLFGTLITVDPERLPVLRLGDGHLRTTVGGLGGLVAECVPGVTLEEFARALLVVSQEMAEARAVAHVELPSRERFRRALVRVGCPGAAVAEAAVELSRAHMRMIVASTVFPPAHAALLATARDGRRVGVVTNFDDTGAAYDILARHRILPALDTVVVSEALGLRKPHPAVVRAGLRGLDLPPADVLFVGDTFAEDVAGAHAAGVPAAWLDADARGVPTGAEPPRHVVRSLPDLHPILARAG